MSGIRLWSKTPGSNTSAPPLGAPELMAPSTVNDIMRQQMSDHRTQWEDAEWFDYGDVPTRTSATTFTVPGDRTATYNKKGRKLKCSDSSTIYGSLLSASFTAVTTVTAVLDAALTASLTAVAVGILSDYRAIPDSLTSWTPGISFGGGTTGITYGSQFGSYIKFGRSVTLFFDFQLSNKGSSGGAARITGLPFPAITATGYCAFGSITWSGMTTMWVSAWPVSTSGASTLDLYALASAATTVSGWDATDLANNTNLRGTITYLAAT